MNTVRKRVSLLICLSLLLSLISLSSVMASESHKLGDVSGDGKVTTADARLALRISAKLESDISPAARTAADFNKDGDVTATDARMILRVSANLEKHPDDNSNNHKDPSLPETKTEILSAYTRVMNKAKAEKPAYKKQEFQSVPGNSEDRIVKEGKAAINIIMDLAGKAFTAETDAKVEELEKGNDMKWFPVAQNEKGNYLTDANFIKSAKSEKLASGNIRLTIVLKDELDSQPTPENSGSPLSKVGAMFHPLSMSDITSSLEDPKIALFVKMEKFSINYHDCTAIIEYNPETDQLISMSQEMVAGLSAKGVVAIITPFEFYQNVYSTLKTWDFKY